MTFNFQGKSPQAIAEDVLENARTIAAVDEAFEALNALADDQRTAALNALEDNLVQAAQMFGMGSAFGSMMDEMDDLFGEDGADDDNDPELDEEAEAVKPIVRALERIAEIKGDQADPWTTAITKRVAQLPAKGQSSAQELMKCIEDAIEDIDGNDGPFGGNPFGDDAEEDFDMPSFGGRSGNSATDITMSVFGALMGDNLESELQKVDALKATDPELYQRVVDTLERNAVDSTKMAGEMLKDSKEANQLESQLSKNFAMAGVKEFYLKSAKGSSTLYKFIAAAKGDATDATLKAYLAAEAQLTPAQRESAVELAQLPLKAIEGAAANNAPKAEVKTAAPKKRPGSKFDL